MKTLNLLVLSIALISCKNKYKLEAEKIILEIENYREEKGEYPSSLENAKVETEGIYYDLCGENEYVLWYGKELGESVIYKSSEQKWSE